MYLNFFHNNIITITIMYSSCHDLKSTVMLQREEDQRWIQRHPTCALLLIVKDNIPCDSYSCNSSSIRNSNISTTLNILFNNSAKKHKCFCKWRKSWLKVVGRHHKESAYSNFALNQMQNKGNIVQVCWRRKTGKLK